MHSNYVFSVWFPIFLWWKRTSGESAGMHRKSCGADAATSFFSADSTQERLSFTHRQTVQLRNFFLCNSSPHGSMILLLTVKKKWPPPAKFPVNAAVLQVTEVKLSVRRARLEHQQRERQRLWSGWGRPCDETVHLFFCFFPPRALTLPVSVAPSPGGQWASNSNALTLSLTSFLTA